VAVSEFTCKRKGGHRAEIPLLYSRISRRPPEITDRADSSVPSVVTVLRRHARLQGGRMMCRAGRRCRHVGYSDRPERQPLRIRPSRCKAPRRGCAAATRRTSSSRPVLAPPRSARKRRAAPAAVCPRDPTLRSCRKTAKTSKVAKEREAALLGVASPVPDQRQGRSQYLDDNAGSPKLSQGGAGCHRLSA